MSSWAPGDRIDADDLAGLVDVGPVVVVAAVGDVDVARVLVDGDRPGISEEPAWDRTVWAPVSGFTRISPSVR